MQEKLNEVFERQAELNVSYTMDELVRGQDYWVNTLLGRPIKEEGADGIDPNIAAIRAYETDEVMYTLTMSDLDELRPLVIDDNILRAAQANVRGTGSRDVIKQMQNKLNSVFD